LSGFSSDEIKKKLFVLKNYDRVFLGAGVRQLLPKCCGRELDLGAFLRTQVKPLEVDVEGETFMMFSVTCPTCGRVIPPEWRTNSVR
jgi:hypothetical protein